MIYFFFFFFFFRHGRLRFSCLGFLFGVTAAHHGD